MRLGSYPCKLSRSGKAVKSYGERTIHERHRHRYEVNNALRPKLVEAGMKITGTSPDKRLVEIIELTGHPWFVATQFHPEFKSRPTRPHPLFRDFVGAAVVMSENRESRIHPGHHSIEEIASGADNQGAGEESVASTDLIDEAG